MKHSLCVILTFLSVTAAAQIRKGQTIWSAHVHSQFTRYSQATIKAPRYSAGGSVDFNFFIRDGLALGLGAGGLWEEAQTMVEEPGGFGTGYKKASWSMTPFVRKYWQIAPVLVYAGGGVDLSFSKVSSTQQAGYEKYEDSFSQNFSSTLQAQLGVIYPVSDRLGLEFGAQSAMFPLSFHSVRLGLVMTGASESGIGKTTLAGSPLARGRWLLSGSFSSELSKGFTTNPDGVHHYRDPSSTIELAPGFFVRDRLMFGLGVFAGLQGGVLKTPDKVGFVNVGNQKPFLIGLRPFVKKYFSPAKLTPYLEGYISYDRIMSGGPATNTYNAGSHVGLAYILGKSWLIEGRLLELSGGYSEIGDMKTDVSTIPGPHSYNLNLEAGLRPSLRVSFVFR